MGASKKRQMRYFDQDWPDKIWSHARSINSGRGAAWLLPLAAIAVTGARPAALEKGIRFSVIDIAGVFYLQARMAGVKLREDRGQPEHFIRWDMKKISTHRSQELKMIARALLASESKELLISYDAEAISTRLREASLSIWPRKKYHITAYCYRELFSGAAKAAGADRKELAIAMGHLSTESQGKYSQRASRRGAVAPPIKPWANVAAPRKVSDARPSMARFKAANSLKKQLLSTRPK